MEIDNLLESEDLKAYLIPYIHNYWLSGTDKIGHRQLNLELV